jgi:HPt (histidine-containing phosphotransfer) domain-containing protein
MQDDERLREHIASLSARYLARTLGEMRRFGELLAEAETGSRAALKELQQAAHKIHGSSGMFGFRELSDEASTIEHIAVRLTGGDAPEHLHGLDDGELRRRLAASVAELDRVARATARTFGIDANAG